MDNKSLKLNATEKRAYWAEHIKQWKSSNLSQNAYCQKASINYRTFNYWIRVTGVRPAESGTRRFIPLRTKVNEFMGMDATSCIHVKLITGVIISIPANVGLLKIAGFIRSLGEPHA